MAKTILDPVEQEPEKPPRHITGLVFELARHLGTAIDRRVAPFNVTGQQAALLIRSGKEPGVTLSHLAPWLGTDNAGVTRLVDRLEVKGLVTRRPSVSDRRAVIVAPTAAGEDLIPQLIAALDEVTEHLTRDLTSDDLTRVESSLLHLLHNLGDDECGPDHGHRYRIKIRGTPQPGESAP
ncbi:MAG TPA: MarR family transcriptional regulator [Chloroflexota bacterium]|nr:MarR family transcriptional regulator [Chloroflexota bacterium]